MPWIEPVLCVSDPSQILSGCIQCIQLTPLSKNLDLVVPPANDVDDASVDTRDVACGPHDKTLHLIVNNAHPPFTPEPQLSLATFDNSPI